MKRWSGAVLIILSLGALTSAFMIAARDQLPTVPLEPGFELRLVKVALGEKTIEPWENLPRKLASYFIPPRFKTAPNTSPARSLEIHLGKFDSARGKFITGRFRDPIVFFPDERFSSGTLLNARSNLVHIEFPSYPRTDERIKVQLTEGERKIALSIPNPYRPEKQIWRHAPLPQTNSTGKISMVLQESGNPEEPFHLTSQSGTSHPQVWTQWHIELFDAYGNWTRLRSNGRSISRPDCPLMGDCFKLIARGREYISAGMVDLPETNRFIRLLPAPRAIDLGVQTAFLLGPGAYEFKEAEAPAVQSPGPINTNSLSLTNNRFEVRTTLPSILLVREQDASFLDSISARLRERRQDERKSKYFHVRKQISATNESLGVVATLFPIPVATGERQLEAEIIAAHRAVEFFVPAKTSGSAK